MALGSLLVNYSQPAGVFIISAAIGFAALFYTMTRLPYVFDESRAADGMAASAHKLMSDIRNVIGNNEFIRTLLCIGVPAKAILTGTITFALPLLLVQSNYRSEDVGQIIMLYGLAVMLATGFASRLVDRTGNSELVLFWGALLSGGGLAMMGMMSPAFAGNGMLGAAAVIGGTILVGIAHGFINAPVVTHVSHSELGQRIGANPVTTAYRFLERAGHIAGPMLAAQIFLLFGQDATVLIWIGVGIAALGLVFVVNRLQPPIRNMPSEAVR